VQRRDRSFSGSQFSNRVLYAVIVPKKPILDRCSVLDLVRMGRAYIYVYYGLGRALFGLFFFLLWGGERIVMSNRRSGFTLSNTVVIAIFAVLIVCSGRAAKDPRSRCHVCSGP